jgi:hypothetical protein
MNTNIKIILSILCLILSYNKSFSQPQTEWVQRFNSPGNYNDYVTDMAIDKSGNVYLTGYVQVNDTDQNFVTIKYNTQGIEQWARYYDGPDHREDKPVVIAVDDSGNVFVTGYSYSYSEFDDILTIKYNENGDSIWTRKFLGIGHVSDRPNAMALDKNGNVYVAGSAVGSNSMDALTLKYNGNGNLEWSRYFNGSTNAYDVAYDLTVGKNDIIYVSGLSFGVGGVILKYDNKGNQLSTIIGSNFYGYKILLDINQNFFLGFDFYGGVQTNNDIAVAKLDSTDKLIWIRSYHHNSLNNNDDFRAICLDNLGDVLVTGVSAEINEQGWDIATIKYYSNGDTAWINRYDPVFNSNDDSKSIASDKYSNVFVAGGSDGGLFSRYVLIKYSPIGNQEWVTFYNNDNPFTSHSALKVLVDTNGNIYITGFSYGNGTNLDIATIKYSNITSLESNSENLHVGFKLYQNFPNPFNSQTIIKYELPSACKVTLKVFNNLGQNVIVLVDEFQSNGEYESVFDGSILSSGIYFYNLEIDGIVNNTKKFILLK